jgi:hypothetical protein
MGHAGAARAAERHNASTEARKLAQLLPNGTGRAAGREGLPIPVESRGEAASGPGAGLRTGSIPAWVSNRSLPNEPQS